MVASVSLLLTKQLEPVILSVMATHAPDDPIA